MSRLSDEQLPPDVKQLIEVLMNTLEKNGWHPKLILGSDDHTDAVQLVEVEAIF